RESAAQALLEAQLAAETDLLTGLFNRRAWERIVAEEEARYARYADPTVAMMMDLDHLKTVNDSQGHAAGDLYIQTAARELASSVKAGDFVARLGGDEFAILLKDCTEDQAEAIVQRIYANFERSNVAGSLGWAPITVVHGFPGAIAQADAAMYAAKSAKRSTHSVL
ncbi:MAG: GGDEF domain-containing protein, partial [Actinomycetota bacterium]|nr:GGDEF domain-containing protein [Actinomycetota bacterium]